MSATITLQADHVLAVERRALASEDETRQFVAELEAAGRRSAVRRLVIDSRTELASSPSDARWSAGGWVMWSWIRSQKSFDMVAFVLPDEMVITRVNMTALSERLSVRAFASLPDAKRWISTSPRLRTSSTALPIVAVATPPGGARLEIDRNAPPTRRTGSVKVDPDDPDDKGRR
jgi:hypothetical protein